MPFSTVFPATRIPNWFKHRREGHAIHIKASPNWHSNNLLGFAVSAVMNIGIGSSIYCNLDSQDRNSESGSSSIYSTFIDDHTRELEITRGDHLWLAYIPFVFIFDSEKWSRILFTFHADSGFSEVKCCGICPMYIRNSSSDEYDSDGNYFSNDDSDEGNPGGSLLNDYLNYVLQDNNGRNPEEEAPSRGSVQEEDVKMGTVSLVLIWFAIFGLIISFTIFGFLYLALIFLWAPRHLPTIWVSPFGADPLGISRLFAAVHLPSAFAVPTLLGILLLLPYFPAELPSVSQFQWRRRLTWLHRSPLQRPVPPEESTHT